MDVVFKVVQAPRRDVRRDDGGHGAGPKAAQRRLALRLLPIPGEHVARQPALLDPLGQLADRRLSVREDDHALADVRAVY